MDEERKSILVAGIYLGDISITLAAMARELPQYLSGLDLSELLKDSRDVNAIRQEVDKALADNPDPQCLPPALLRLVLDRATAKGKFLSATRCLEILGEREKCIGKYLSKAQALVKEGKLEEAAEDIVVASSLELDEGTPFFQYSGPALHEACTSTVEKCIARSRSEEAVLKALQYLLEGKRTCEMVEALSPDLRKSLLVEIAAVRDRDVQKFIAAHRQAHMDLVEIETKTLADIREHIRRAAGAVATFAESTVSLRQAEGVTADAMGRLVRTAESLRKEMQDVETLLDNWQLRRVRRRLEHLLDSASELEQIGGGLGEGGRSGSQIAGMLDAVKSIAAARVIEALDEIENRIASTQATLLGRKVYSQEHWQYLRELAFKYPASPLMCCVRKLNEGWIVMPLWEGGVASILREGLEPAT